MVTDIYWRLNNDIRRALLSTANIVSHLSTQRLSGINGIKTPFYSEGKCQKSLPKNTVSAMSPPGSKTFDDSQGVRIKAQPPESTSKPPTLCPILLFSQYFPFHSCQSLGEDLKLACSSLLPAWLGLAA